MTREGPSGSQEGPSTSSAGCAPTPTVQEVLPGTGLIEIGSTFINLDRSLRAHDLFARTEEAKLVVRPDCGEQAPMPTGQDAYDLQARLNSVTVAFHAAGDPDAGG